MHRIVLPAGRRPDILQYFEEVQRYVLPQRRRQLGFVQNVVTSFTDHKWKIDTVVV